MEVSDQVIRVLDNLCEKIGITIDWSQKSVMPYLQELFRKYVKYEMAMSIVWILISIAIIILEWKLAKKLCDSNRFDEELIILGIVILVMIGIGFWGIAIEQIFNIAVCMTFPEKLILDELIKLAT